MSSVTMTDEDEAEDERGKGRGYAGVMWQRGRAGALPGRHIPDAGRWLL